MQDEPIIPMRWRDTDPNLNLITGNVLDGAIAVQNILGSGVLEKPYEIALAHELELRGHDVRTQVPLTMRYKSIEIPNAYFIDIIVDGCVPVELKTAEVHPQHLAQLSTYLRFGGFRVGLLINFRAVPLKTGFHRIVV